jgi:membrane protease YdiL (CAAX protease family)
MPRSAPAPPVDYFTRTRDLPVNLLFLVPWIVVYQLCLVATDSPVDNAAGAFLKALLHSLGRGGFVAVTLLASLLLCVAVLVRLKEAPKDRGIYGLMLCEGVLYGALLGTVARVLASSLPLGRMVPLAATEGAAIEALRGHVQELGLSVGAGVFEEVLFRGVLLTGLWALLRHAVGADRVSAAVLALLGSAWVFSAWHHWGVGGEPFVASVFAFRFWAGVALGGIFLARGIGIAAFAHGFYDVLVLASS